MALKLVKEWEQTGESWAIYEATVTSNCDWTEGIRVTCYVDSNGRIQLNMPHYEDLI